MDRRISMTYEKQAQAGLTNEQEPFAEDWQEKVEDLQKAVCLLLIKNQTMRMALSDEKRNYKFGEFS
jgi:hypothetical protein